MTVRRKKNKIFKEQSFFVLIDLEEKMDDQEKKVPETTTQPVEEKPVSDQEDQTAAQQPHGQDPYGNPPYGQQPYGQRPYGQQAYGPQGMYQQPYSQPQPGNGLAIASLILGICSIPLAFFFSIGGIVCGIIGLILAIMAKNRGNLSGMRTGGLICSIIGLVISIILLIISIIAVFMAMSMVGSLIGGGIDYIGNGGLNDIINNLGGNSRSNNSIDLNSLINLISNLGGNSGNNNSIDLNDLINGLTDSLGNLNIR